VPLPSSPFPGRSNGASSIGRLTRVAHVDDQAAVYAETAPLKVQAAEDAWNSRDPERVALAYSEDSEWRNRTEFFQGREAIKAFLRRKWSRELDYRLKKTLWGFRDNRMA
jgi:Uncharacterized protein conserved in bacteria